MNWGRTERPLVLLILLAAVLLRLWRLDEVPPGLTHDEANNIHDAASILDGERPVYFPVAQGKEPLYPYTVAALMVFLGRSAWVMRLCSALWGLLTIVMSYAWARRAFGPAVALMTAAGLTVGFWPLSTARMGLRAIALPALFSAATWLLWRGMGVRPGKNRPGNSSVSGSAIAGLALGLSLYTYLASRLMPLVFMLFALFLYLFGRDAWRRMGKWVVLALVVAAVAAAPLFLYLNAHPAAEIRIGQLDRPLRALLAGEPGPLLERSKEAALMISFEGDTFIPYNIPGKPLLDPVMSVLFYSGLLMAVRRWRQPAYAFALLWFGVGMTPALATGVDAANLRAIAAQPVVYLFPSLSLAAIGRFATGRVERWPSLVIIAGGAAFFVIVGALTGRDYFYRWAPDRDVRVHYHTDLVAIAKEIEAVPRPITAISALYPGQYHDPRIVEAELQEGTENLRWFDGRAGLFLPHSEGARMIIPAGMAFDPALRPLVELELLERVPIRANDLVPSFDLFLATSTLQPPASPLAQFGDPLLLLDARTDPEQPVAGEVVAVVTVWQVASAVAPDRDAVLFAQMLDSNDRVVAQDDRLDFPSWNWEAGDRFAQLFRMNLPADLPAGRFRLVLGAYTVPDRVDAVLAGSEPDPSMPRWRVSFDGKPVGDVYQILLIEVPDGGF